MEDGKPSAIKCPCLVAMRLAVLPLEKRQLRLFLYRGGFDQGFVLKRGLSEKVLVAWLLDRTGMLRLVQIVQIRRSWTRPLRWLHDFSVADCQVTDGRRATVKELKELIKPIASAPGFNDRGKLMGYLRTQDENTEFTETMFREYWAKHCPPVGNEEWQEEL